MLLKFNCELWSVRSERRHARTMHPELLYLWSFNSLPQIYFADNTAAEESTAQTLITFEPVQAATTSWIVYGVTITMKPNEMAAIVLDVDPLKTLSCSTI